MMSLPAFGKGVEHRIDRRNHQVNVHHLLGVRAQRLHHHRADRDVGHEMPVHHIDMHPVRPGGIDGAHFLAETREIRREDGGGDENGPVHERIALPARALRRNRTGRLVHGNFAPKNARLLHRHAPPWLQNLQSTVFWAEKMRRLMVF
jgi:hypothetical protein